jgi:uncharacterized membrane protein
MGYEFTTEQSNLFRSLAGKMGLVGLMAVVIGVLNLVSALMLLVFVFQDRLPAEVLEQIPAEARAELPPTDFLWGLLIQGATMGLIFLLIGVWTRAAAASFRDIAETAGRDISHLMDAVGSLYKMYRLMYTLIIVALIVFLAGLALQVYLRYAA